jgi:hypothetical protein
LPDVHHRRFFVTPRRVKVAQCNATTPGIFPIIAQHEIDDCAAAYGRMGWQKQKSVNLEHGKALAIKS